MNSLFRTISETTSDPVKVAIFNSFMAFLGTIVTSVVVVLLAKINKKAGDAMVAAEKVKENLADVNERTKNLLHHAAREIQSIKDTGEVTHAIVNSSRSRQLELTATAMSRIADLTQNPEDIAAAIEAKRLVFAPQEEWDSRQTNEKKENEPFPQNMKLFVTN